MSKDSPRTTAGEFQKIVESRGQKNGQTAPISPHIVWESFKKNDPSSSQKLTPAYSVIRHDFKWDWLLWSDVT